MVVPENVKARLDVSRETIERLEKLAELLEKWNPKINLVSKSTIADLWNRHILDSTQLFKMSPDIAGHWLDIGSGGGFPGLVVAILNTEKKRPWQVTMIESDIRKCTFLRTVLRETGVSAEVITKRIESAEPQNADVLSARALADLDKLNGFAEIHLKTTGVALFPKGNQWKKELEFAQKSWKFNHEAINSETQEGSVILKIEGITRV
ncbi:16S rRNA (guanine(527)-N(7))-methyltransferase RsmG [Cognatishimia sp. WU-CL00825]|uniref:16S rRNA (guanine(527)-N(7))-methyltransferase RsmG n=1 Tax=Cognatishimia sp. WU-CL00825 TaxID=3127658 RepID=UPI00336541CA